MKENLIAMWQSQLNYYSCLKNNYQWDKNNLDYIFLQEQFDKVINLLKEYNNLTQEEVDEKQRLYFSEAVKEACSLQKRKYSILKETENLTHDEFNELCVKMKDIIIDLRQQRALKNMTETEKEEIGKFIDNSISKNIKRMKEEFSKLAKTITGG